MGLESEVCVVWKWCLVAISARDEPLCMTTDAAFCLCCCCCCSDLRGSKDVRPSCAHCIHVEDSGNSMDLDPDTIPWRPRLPAPMCAYLPARGARRAMVDLTLCDNGQW